MEISSAFGSNQLQLAVRETADPYRSSRWIGKLGGSGKQGEPTVNSSLLSQSEMSRTSEWHRMSEQQGRLD
jgi:hypothetical protein